MAGGDSVPSMSNIHRGAIAVVLGLALAACGGDKDKGDAKSASSGKPASSAKASSEPAANAQTKGAAGAGDKSGKDVANAQSLTKEKPTSFDLGCKQAVFVGPFVFVGAKDALKVRGEAKSKKGDQACVGGAWVDEKGEFIATSGIGCAEGDKASNGEPVLEFDPQAGGNDHRTVFLKVSMEESVCADVSVKLSLP